MAKKKWLGRHICVVLKRSKGTSLQIFTCLHKRATTIQKHLFLISLGCLFLKNAPCLLSYRYSSDFYGSIHLPLLSLCELGCLRSITIRTFHLYPPRTPPRPILENDWTGRRRSWRYLQDCQDTTSGIFDRHHRNGCQLRSRDGIQQQRTVECTGWHAEHRKHCGLQP
jgi:hypothetical protein